MRSVILPSLSYLVILSVPSGSVSVLTEEPSAFVTVLVVSVRLPSLSYCFEVVVLPSELTVVTVFVPSSRITVVSVEPSAFVFVSVNLPSASKTFTCTVPDAGTPSTAS